MAIQEQLEAGMAGSVEAHGARRGEHRSIVQIDIGYLMGQDPEFAAAIGNVLSGNGITVLDIPQGERPDLHVFVLSVDSMRFYEGIAQNVANQTGLPRGHSRG